MSDIFNPPPLPDHRIIDCPECGVIRGVACGWPAASWNCGSRIWVAAQIIAIAALTQPEPPRVSPSRDDYAAGWNDAVAAIVDRLREVRR